MSEDNKFLSKESTARENAMNIIVKHYNNKLTEGEYAHELISETYINLVSQAQSGMCLLLEGQILDLKTSKPQRIPNTDIYLNGYRIGRYTISYQQDLPSTTSFYNQEANLRIVVDGFLAEEQLDNPDYQTGTTLYDGKFKDITRDALNILEKCLEFSALNYDLYLEKKLLEMFSKSIKQLGRSLNDLPLLNDKIHKL